MGKWQQMSKGRDIHGDRKGTTKGGGVENHPDLCYCSLRGIDVLSSSIITIATLPHKLFMISMF